MTVSQQDMWSQWLLNRRFGGDPQRMKLVFDYLYPIRDKVLSHVDLQENGTLLDVGCGDGLISFGALEKFQSCRVIFGDISEDLLHHCEALAKEMNVQDRCTFVNASADDLSMLEGESVDAVTTRSVLIYVPAKQQAFNEFYRVLKHGGALSIFEPINRYSFPEPTNRYDGFDVTPIADITQKLVALWQRIQPENDPMVDFDERDLLRYVEDSRFSEIHLELQVEVKPHKKEDWSVYIHTASNPKIPTLEEAMQEMLTQEETQRFVNYMRPLVEAGEGTHRLAVAYLWAIK